MTRSQPSSSKPQNERISASSQTLDWEQTVSLRPNPELQRVLSKSRGLEPAPFPELDTPTRSLKVARRPPPPPPPVQLSGKLDLPRLRSDSVPDWNDVSTRLIQIPTSAPTGIAPTSVAPTAMESRGEPPRTVHARPLELSVAVLATMVLTLLGSFAVRHASWSSSEHALASAAPTASPTPAQLPPAKSAPGWSAGSAPIVSVHDLPTEAKAAAPALERASNLGKAGSAFDDVALDQALVQATREASACGASPITAPVEITFAPSGAVRFVRFVTAVPQAPVRICALKAVARARVPAFKGDAITVSKTLSW